MDSQRKLCTPKLNNGESMLGKMECSFLGQKHCAGKIITVMGKANP